MTDVDPARLRADGVAITLRDGSTVNVRFGMLALAILEDEFGSLVALNDVFDESFDEKGNLKGKLIRPLTKVLRAGLAECDGFETDRDVLLRLDEQRLTEYTTAFFEAMRQSQPDAVGKAEPLVSNGTSASPGEPSTTSAPSGSVAAMLTSGA